MERAQSQVRGSDARTGGRASPGHFRHNRASGARGQKRSGVHGPCHGRRPSIGAARPLRSEPAPRRGAGRILNGFAPPARSLHRPIEKIVPFELMSPRVVWFENATDCAVIVAPIHAGMFRIGKLTEPAPAEMAKFADVRLALV
jgi:hypothetical protein